MSEAKVRELLDSARKSVVAMEGMLQAASAQLQANEQTLVIVRRKHARAEGMLARLVRGDDLRAILIEVEEQTLSDDDEIMEQLDQEMIRATEAVSYQRFEIARATERIALLERQLLGSGE